jgi:hypothetical protein
LRKRKTSEFRSEPFLGREKPLEFHSKPFLGREKPSKFRSKPFLGREKPLEFRFKPFLDEKISQFHSEPFSEEKKPQNSVLNHFQKRKIFGTRNFDGNPSCKIKKFKTRISKVDFLFFPLKKPNKNLSADFNSGETLQKTRLKIVMPERKNDVKIEFSKFSFLFIK